jgi:restriction system protein
MVMPKFSDLFTDVLQSLSDGNAWKLRDLRNKVVEGLKLTENERSETIASGEGRAFNRVYWACECLAQSRAVFRPQRGFMQITDLGRELLAENLEGVTLEHLRQTEGMQEWERRSEEMARARRSQAEVESSTPLTASDSEYTPEEQIKIGVARLRAAVASDLLTRVRNESLRFLEQVVLKVLHAMGYGEGEDDLEHLGGSGDEGVDGVINQDRLGLDQVYVQAKRYREGGTIGRPDIQAFVGALSGKGATRGVFITTSRFSQDARGYAAKLSQPRIILIDGNELSDLMLDNGIAVTTDRSNVVFKIDENFFELD